jgi:hypothetical protein
MRLYSNGKNVYSVDMMLAYVNINKPKAVMIPVEEFTHVLDYPGWSGADGANYSARDVLDKPRKYPAESRRIREANLTYAILIHKQGKHMHVVDGVHRITKAYLTKRVNIKCIVLTNEEMKKFKLSGDGDWRAVEERFKKEGIHALIEQFVKKM